MAGKGKLFLFFFVSFSVGKNQICLTERWLFTLTHNVSRLCVRAGLLPGNVLLKTLISRIRNLSTEDENPAWRIAAVVARFFANYFFIAEIIINIGLLISSFISGYFFRISSEGFGSDISRISKFD